MSNGKKPDAAKKLAAEVPLPGISGPMLGKNGPLDPLFVRDDTLQDALTYVIEDKANPDKILSDSDLKNKKKKDLYAFAVVDITYDASKPTNVPGTSTYDKTKPVNDPNKVAYAGWNDRTNFYIASLVKVLPLYAAFQLRADMRGLFLKLKNDSGGVSPDMAKLKDEAKKRYEIIYAGLDISTINIPALEKIFTLDGGAVNFLKVKKGDAGFVNSNFKAAELSDEYLNSIDKNSAAIDKVKFYEHMRLMVGWSNNHAASLVIDALDYEYLWAFVNRSGLYRSSWDILTKDDKTATEACGLFLAWNFGGRAWRNRPARAKGIEISLQGTARSVALLMTMLGREKLIDHDAHIEMYEMLRKDVDFTQLVTRGEFSPIGTGMYKSGWKNQQVEWTYGNAIPSVDPNMPLGCSKIGLDPPDYSNTLLVRTKRDSGKTIAAVLVVINNSESSPKRPMVEAFGKQMALKLDARHP